MFAVLRCNILRCSFLVVVFHELSRRIIKWLIYNTALYTCLHPDCSCSLAVCNNTVRLVHRKIDSLTCTKANLFPTFSHWYEWYLTHKTKISFNPAYFISARVARTTCRTLLQNLLSVVIRWMSTLNDNFHLISYLHLISLETASNCCIQLFLWSIFNRRIKTLCFVFRMLINIQEDLQKYSIHWKEPGKGSKLQVGIRSFKVQAQQISGFSYLIQDSTAQQSDQSNCTKP